MGNTFVRSSKGAHDDSTPAPAAPSQPRIPFRPQCQPSGSSGLSNHTVGSIKFQSNHSVPKEPSEHATGSEKAQAKWYTNILGWKESPPTTSGEASSLVSQVFKVGTDALTGFMSIMERLNQLAEHPSLPEGVKYKLNTLPVKAKLVGDGDGMTVHVSTTDPRESARVPLDVQKAAIERRQARANKDYDRADKIREFIKQTTDYRFGTEDDLVRECRIRLRGIDAPEMDQEYGQEAKDALRKLIQEKPLKIYVYESDKYGRLVGDVYCRGELVQERLLKKGCAWHYEAFDKRPEFGQWQREARNARRGLWANSNPVAPWDFKRNDPNKKNGRKPCCSGRNSQRDHAFAIYAS